MHWLTRMTIPLFGLALLPGLCHALTVASTMQVLSPLGQPLHGKVMLSELGDLTADDIKAYLGSDNDFKQAGLSGNIYYPGDLKFKVVVNDSDSYIDISTTRPVNEPTLDFVLHVAWPHNDRLNEITVILDPPAPGSKSPSDSTAK